MMPPPKKPLRPIADLARALDLPADAWEPYGRYRAKVDHRLAQDAPRRGSKLVLVTAVNPTPAGEGKTVHTIGLSMALERIGRRTIATLRQPSMGPIFGVKGGGCGGGASTLEPAEQINLHLTGDFHAVAAANNLLCAALDTSMLLGNPAQLDPERVSFPRVVDMNDRALRQIRIGLGGAQNGVPRDAAFTITSASEVMAILALSTSIVDLRRRLGAIQVGERLSGEPVQAEELGVAGAMAALLRDALDPTLVQTVEGTPALVHTGPFANIAHGNCSILADRIAAAHADYVVTEAGFGADMGAEKFFNLKCRISGMRPDAAVLVTTVRALKVHSGKFLLKPGKALPKELEQEDLAAVEAGLPNLEAHLETLRLFGVPAVVAINRFPTDTPAELARIEARALAAGASSVAQSFVFAQGGEGGRALAEAVVAAAESGRADFRPLYGLELPLKDKLARVATQVYGAAGVSYEARAQEQLWRAESQGHGRLPICVAKTQFSLSHDPKLLGRPRGYDLSVRGLTVLAGAGFAVPLCGDIQTMPGLGSKPSYRGIDLDADGRIVGL
jgi:formate--tetrahydrofolate ligase